MSYTIIRYGVKDAELAENRALVTKVFEALAEAAPPAVGYLVLELDNGQVWRQIAGDLDR